MANWLQKAIENVKAQQAQAQGREPEVSVPQGPMPKAEARAETEVAPKQGNAPHGPRPTGWIGSAFDAADPLQKLRGPGSF